MVLMLLNISPGIRIVLESPQQHHLRRRVLSLGPSFRTAWASRFWQCAPSEMGSEPLLPSWLLGRALAIVVAAVDAPVEDGLLASFGAVAREALMAYLRAPRAVSYHAVWDTMRD